MARASGLGLSTARAPALPGQRSNPTVKGARATLERGVNKPEDAFSNRSLLTIEL